MGLENVLAEEIKQIGGKNIRKGGRAVYYTGNLETIYKSNYYLRTALRVLKEINFFTFKNVDQFYLRCKQTNWERFFGVEQSFMINSVVIDSKEFKNSMFASLKVKDAIADYFRDKLGKRPSVDTTNPDIYINVHIHRNNCTLSLDSSGESLHKRGYRVKQGDAPLSEVLAAGLIKITGWNGNSDFMDPMCGSGTLPIEAAMIAQNIPAGKFRKFYAFENWPDFNMDLYEKVKTQVNKREFKHKIYASDISASNLLNAQTNARRALVFNKIIFSVSDFKELNTPLKNTTIIINPPYGERLNNYNLDKLYSNIGSTLKHSYTDNAAWILSSSFESIKNIGLRPSVKIDVLNGALKCKFLNYKLFKGKA